MPVFGSFYPFRRKGGIIAGSSILGEISQGMEEWYCTKEVKCCSLWKGLKQFAAWVLAGWDPEVEGFIDGLSAFLRCCVCVCVLEEERNEMK